MTRERWWAVRVVNEQYPLRNGWLDNRAWHSASPCCFDTREEARRIARIPGLLSDVHIVKRITVEYD
jgi:hypothetical protein